MAITTKWRFYITANNGGSFTYLPEIVLKDEAGGSSILGGATVDASSEFSAAYVAEKAIDGDDYSAWVTTVEGVVPAWLEITLASAAQVVEYDINGRSNVSFGEESPKDWQLQSSSDGGVTWDVEHEVTGETGWVNSETRTFTVDVDPHFIADSNIAISPAADLLYRIEGRPTILGDSSIAIVPSSTFNFHKVLEGSSQISLTASAVLGVKRNITGASSIAFTANAELSSYHLIGAIDGDCNVSINAAADLLSYKQFSIAGSVNITLSQQSIMQAYVPVLKKTISQRRYICTFSADGYSDVTIPVSSITGSLSNNVSSVVVVVPNGVKYADDIVNRAAGTVVIKAIEIYTDGSSASTDTDSFDIARISQDKGSRSFSVTVRATATLTASTLPKKVGLQSVVYVRTNEIGKRNVRCGLDKDLLPNDIAAVSESDSFIVERITQVINGPEMFMELMEA